MYTPIETAQLVLHDVECGAIDSGLVEKVVIGKPAKACSGACASDESDSDFQCDVNYSGISLMDN